MSSEQKTESEQLKSDDALEGSGGSARQEQ